MPKEEPSTPNPPDRPDEPLPGLTPANRGPITWRSVGVGLAGVCFIALLTPFNDNALNNTFLIGNNLPLGVMILLFALAVLVNGSLSRYAPDRAFSSGELTVVLALMLAGCAVPGSGLIRYLPATLVAPWHVGGTNESYLALLETLDLPHWLFPRLEGDGPRQWTRDPTVVGYFWRWTDETTPPYAVWIRPILAWGIMLVAFWGAMFCMVALIRRQWIENERLAFPLAQIQLALVQAPPRGRWLNDLLGARAFWIACLTILAIRIWNGMGEYFPRQVAEIPLAFDLGGLFREPPLSYVMSGFYRAEIFFIAVGVTYFLNSSVALSLWLFFVFQQIFKMFYGTATGTGYYNGTWEQHMGGIIALAMLVFWIGRAHWALILRQAFRGVQPGEPEGRYLSYRFAFWGLAGCAAVMVAWLSLAGMHVWHAVVIVLLLLTLFLMITRIIAETGLVYGQILFPLYYPWQIITSHGLPEAIPTKTVFLTGMMHVNTYDVREPLPVYASHAVRVADKTIFEDSELARDTRTDPRQRSVGRNLIGLMLLAVALSYVLSFSSMLWTEYNHAVTLDASEQTVNEWGTHWAQLIYVQRPSLQHETGGPRFAFSPLSHITFGFIVTAALGFLRLTFTWWPLHPIGYIMIPTNPTNLLWFSIFLGWLVKTLIVRFGGATMFSTAKPLFLGMIMGDCLAAGFWLVTNLILAALGAEYTAVHIMPH